MIGKVDEQESRSIGGLPQDRVDVIMVCGDDVVLRFPARKPGMRQPQAVHRANGVLDADLSPHEGHVRTTAQREHGHEGGSRPLAVLLPSPLMSGLGPPERVVTIEMVGCQ